MKLKYLLTPLLLSSLICSCATLTPANRLATYQAYDLPAKLPSNPQRVAVKVSLKKQRVYVTEGSQMLLAMPVSVGAPKSPTPAGRFQIYQKTPFKRANSHGFAYLGSQVKKSMIHQKPRSWNFTGTPMPYWCEFKPNYGFHTGWIKHHPCTHGCIRMHENLAPKFFRLVSVGTPVHIAYSQPEDSSYGNLSLPPDAGPLPDYPTSMYTGNGYFKQHKSPSFQ